MNVKIKSLHIVVRNVVLFASLLVSAVLFISSVSAFASTSIQSGWTAQDQYGTNITDKSKQPYSATDKPIKKIVNASGKTVNLPANSVSYMYDSKTNTVNVLIIGSKIGSEYKDAMSLSYELRNPSIQDVNVAPVKSYYCNGLTKVKPKVSLTWHGSTLVLNKDYKVTYGSNKKPGTGTITITGLGKYANSKRTVKFKLVNMGDDLARAACKLSYSRPAYANAGNGHPGGYYGTKQYIAAIKKYVPKYMNSFKGRACHQGMRISITSAGYWKGWTAEDVSQAPRSVWKYIGTYGKNKSKLLPGDVLVTPNIHYYMYVGKTIPQEIYKKYIKGKGKKKGDLGKPTNDTAWVSAHHAGGMSAVGSAALCMGNAKYAGAKKISKIYRCVKPNAKKYRVGKVVS